MVAPVPNMGGAVISGDPQTNLINEIFGVRPTAQEQFLAYHAANPHIYARLRAMALQLKRAGHDRWGIKNLWEKLRYDLAAEARDPNNPFTLNNNYTAYYARRLMKREPELAGFFEIRERQVDK